MKKRTLTRLSLKRETLAPLQQEDMSKVEGAATMAACCYNSDSCPPNTGRCSALCPTLVEDCS
jgi:hypothetical protein